MGKKKKSTLNLFEDDAPDYRVETIQMKKVTTETVYYDLKADDLPVLPDGTIQYELNLVEMPIFSKNRHVKDAQAVKYVFDGGMDEFLMVVPSTSPLSASNKILQEFDEKIYYALLLIFQMTGKRRIVTDIFTLLRTAKIIPSGKTVSRTKDSLERLKQCDLIFNKCYFDPVAKTMGADFIKQTKHLNLLSSLEFISFQKYQKIKKSAIKQEYKQQFERDGHIKEIIVATLNEDIVRNIKIKSFKYFEHEDLLTLNNATARKLYIMLTKWRFWVKQPILTRRVKFLASRIPLSWNKKSVHSTVHSLLHACDELKEKGKIADYVFKKERDFQLSTIDFCFTENCLLDRLNAEVGNETTGTEENAIVDEQQEEILDIKPFDVESVETKPIKKDRPNSNFSTEADVDALFALVREEFREKLTVRGIIIKALDEHDIEYIRRNILYANKNANGNYRAYLAKALDADWGLAVQEDHQDVAKVQDTIQATLSEVDAKEKAERDAREKYWSSLGAEAQAVFTKKVQCKFKCKDQNLLMGFAMSLAWDAAKKEKTN